ncbi:response regulator [Methanoculleus sp. Wushi-C6]|uniref:histidine kinase n=1 Tax=Methanoculleus caldifontis TaxID=2651577 RepID=A0ABU3WZW5_9EURY|nr:response regulator [Methanoculleus sp. Wushi-C6]MDV2481316.1 response regulator [Methanoculleus sp. Wushi-C6]
MLPTARYSVLYVDDELTLLDVGKAFLEASGALSIETAPSGRDALARLDELAPDAVIADYRMHDMDGIELLKEIRQRFGDLPFILFTGRGREEVVVEALNHGADGYVQKGGDPRSQFAELEHLIVQAVERRRAVLALRDSEERYRALFEGANDPIFIFEGDRFVDCNSKALETFRCTREVLIGRRPWELSAPIQPDGVPARESAVEKMKAAYAGEPQFFEWRIHGPSSRIYDTEMSLSRLDVKGPPRLQAIVRDVTDRRRTENDLIAANRKMHLLSSITRHDILNQLTVLQGYLGLTRDQTADPVLLGYLDRQETAIEFIRRQIAFTQDYQDLGVRAPEYQDLGDCIARAAKGLALDLILLAGVDGVEVYADPMLEKVFYNIFENTLRYAGPAPTVRVGCSRQDGGQVVVVEDDGPGIPAGEKEKIFARGFGRNTGLGLFLVREILATTGIVIHETGEAGRGARFELLVPERNWQVRAGGTAAGP